MVELIKALPGSQMERPNCFLRHSSRSPSSPFRLDSLGKRRDKKRNWTISRTNELALADFNIIILMIYNRSSLPTFFSRYVASFLSLLNLLKCLLEFICIISTFGTCVWESVPRFHCQKKKNSLIQNFF